MAEIPTELIASWVLVTDTNFKVKTKNKNKKPLAIDIVLTQFTKMLSS